MKFAVTLYWHIRGSWTGRAAHTMPAAFRAAQNIVPNHTYAACAPEWLALFEQARSSITDLTDAESIRMGASGVGVEIRRAGDDGPLQPGNLVRLVPGHAWRDQHPGVGHVEQVTCETSPYIVRFETGLFRTRRSELELVQL